MSTNTRISYKQFQQQSFARGADYIEPQFEGRKNNGRVMISAIAVVQRFPKVIGIWVKNKGIVWTDNVHYES